MIKIGIVGYNPKKIGGIEAFSRCLKDNLPYNVEFVYEYDEDGPFQVSGVNPVLKYRFIIRVLNKISRQRYSLSKINELLAKKKYDVIILNSPKYLKLVPCLEKTILVQHTTVENWWASKYKFDKNTELLELSKKVYKIISLSEYEKHSMLLRLNYKSELVKTVHMINDIPIREVPPSPKKTLIMLTRFQNDIKRIDLVIKSMRLLPDFHLNIYGDGIDKKYLMDLASSFDNVSIHPATSDKIKALDSNGIYILSSEFEGFPVSLIEAMARGLPIIVRNSFLSAPCFVNDNGKLLPKKWSDEEFRDAVYHCYLNYKHLSLASLACAIKHTSKNVIPEWCKLIESVGHRE